MKPPIRLAIFASGSGTNAQNIVHYFSEHPSIKIERAFVNNPAAGVIQKMKKINIPVFLFNKTMLYEDSCVLKELKSSSIDFIILAGFLWLIPSHIIENYENKIINIHPALLPKYGGKGMYGNHVHKQVLLNKDKVSGITIHLVNKEYDQGTVLFQATCRVLEGDTIEKLAQRIHSLEYLHYPKVIEAWITSSLNF